jgi:L-ribulokinase
MPGHAPWIIQVYADVFDREISTVRTTQGSAMGAAIVAAVAAGEFATVEAAQDVLVHFNDHRYVPDTEAAATYDRLYGEFVTVHDAFAASGALGGVMKSLLEIRDAAVKEPVNA